MTKTTYDFMKIMARAIILTHAIYTGIESIPVKLYGCVLF
jgi:hypothetical protein